MARVMCYRCFWPQTLCWCASLRPMPTRTRLVFLMHPKEFKEEKAGTGRLTHLCLPNSELRMGVGFDEDARVQALIRDPQNFPVLLYPGKDAVNLSVGAPPKELSEPLASRRLVVFLLDGTWSGARKMLRLSPSLQRLPRIMFTPSAPSRYVIKQQPVEGCLSTLEAVHELLLALAKTGLDHYADQAQLLDVFKRMQDYQIACAADPNRTGYRRQAYSAPEERTLSHGRSGARRMNYLNRPDAPTESPQS
jgi:DTW domain-containing protein YfiP